MLSRRVPCLLLRHCRINFWFQIIYHAAYKIIHSLTSSNVEVKSSLVGTDLMLQNMSLHYMTCISFLMPVDRTSMVARKVASAAAIYFHQQAQALDLADQYNQVHAPWYLYKTAWAQTHVLICPAKSITRSFREPEYAVHWKCGRNAWSLGSML